MSALLITYELSFLLSTIGLYIDSEQATPTLQVYLVPACEMLNSLTLYIFIFEIERIRLFLSEPEKHKFEEKREKIKAILFVVIVSLLI